MGVIAGPRLVGQDRAPHEHVRVLAFGVRLSAERSTLASCRVRTSLCMLGKAVLGWRELDPIILRGSALQGAASAERSDTTSVHKPTLDDAAIVSGAQDAVAIFNVVLSDNTTERYCKMAVLPGRSWYGTQSRLGCNGRRRLREGCW